MSNLFMMSKNTITVIMNNEQFTFRDTQPLYEALKDELTQPEVDWESVWVYLHPKDAVLNYSGNTVSIVDNVFYYKTLAGTKMKLSVNAIVTRILELFESNKPYEYMIKFLENVAKNPNNNAINELYLFLEDCGLPLTSDGCFLAYKRVNSSYKDIYTNKISNKIGTMVTMDRAKVDSNREQTCSVGLHFCAKGYLTEYGNASSKIMIVKINPMDVVAIPSDYNNMKGRCCKYIVVGEVDNPDDIKNFIDTPTPDVLKHVDEANPEIIEEISLKDEIKTPKKKEEMVAKQEKAPESLKKEVKGDKKINTSKEAEIGTKENPFCGTIQSFLKALPRENRVADKPYYIKSEKETKMYKFIKTIGDRAFRVIKTIFAKDTPKPTKEKTVTVVEKPKIQPVETKVKAIESKDVIDDSRKIEKKEYPSGVASIVRENGKVVRIVWEGQLKRFLREFDKSLRVVDVDIIIENKSNKSTYRFFKTTSEDNLKKIK